MRRSLSQRGKAARSTALFGIFLGLACGLGPGEVGVSVSPSAHAQAGRPRAAGGSPSARSARAARPLRISLISDMNGGYGSTHYATPVHAAIERILQRRPDLVLSTGDMVAGQRQGLSYRSMWRAFHRTVSDPLKRAALPFLVTPGNHDASGYPRYEREREIFAEEWRARPRPAVQFLDDAHYPLRYSFTSGGVFFLSLDATQDGPLSEAQMAWIDAQLREAAGYRARIVFGHIPLYPLARGREREHIGDPRLEELLRERHVDLFISGHHHAYYPGRRGSLRLLAMPCLGGGPRPLIGGPPERSPRALVELEIAADGAIRFEAYTGDQLSSPIRRGGLPARVGLPGMWIDRDDLPL